MSAALILSVSERGSIDQQYGNIEGQEGKKMEFGISVLSKLGTNLQCTYLLKNT